MKINTSQRLPGIDPDLYDLLKRIAVQLNGISEGAISAHYTAYTAPPTTGRWAQGDFQRNSAPVEAGVALSKYVVLGWICTVGGEPGTWLECRVPTGN